MQLLKLLAFCSIFLILSSCSTPTTNSNNTNPEEKIVSPKENKIIKIQSSLPTPTPTTMAMFDLLEDGTYSLPNGENKTGQLVRIYSTDGDHLPKHVVGVGSEFEMVDYRYLVVNIVRSENYEESSDEAWVEVLGPVVSDEKSEEE